MLHLCRKYSFGELPTECIINSNQAVSSERCVTDMNFSDPHYKGSPVGLYFL